MHASCGTTANQETGERRVCQEQVWVQVQIWRGWTSMLQGQEQELGQGQGGRGLQAAGEASC